MESEKLLVSNAEELGDRNGDSAMGLNSVSSVKPPHLESCESESMEPPSNTSEQNLDNHCNDFASTFMFDEELELEQKTIKKDHHSLTRYSFLHLLIIALPSCCPFYCHPIRSHMP